MFPFQMRKYAYLESKMSHKLFFKLSERQTENIRLSQTTREAIRI